MRGRSRATALLVAVLALIGPPGPAPVAAREAPARAAAVTARIHHYNLCQGNAYCIQDKEYRQGALNLLRWFAIAEGAWFVSVNEVCRADYEALRPDLNNSGLFRAAAHRKDGCPEDGPYGIAIFSPGGVITASKTINLPNPGRDCSTQECRLAVCAHVTTYAGPMTVCTTHLATDPAVAQSQAGEYFRQAREFNAEGGSGRRLVMAGDLNLTPAELPLYYDALMVDLVSRAPQPSAPGYQPDGNTHRTWGDNGNMVAPNRHIDYIFVERGVGTPRVQMPYCRHPDHLESVVKASDHCYTKGHWEL